MLRLNLNQPDGSSGIRTRIANVYDRIAGGDDYQRNEKSLGQIQLCVITLSAVATGAVNAFGCGSFRTTAKLQKIRLFCKFAFPIQVNLPEIWLLKRHISLLPD